MEYIGLSAHGLLTPDDSAMTTMQVLRVDAGISNSLRRVLKAPLRDGRHHDFRDRVFPAFNGSEPLARGGDEHWVVSPGSRHRALATVPPEPVADQRPFLLSDVMLSFHRLRGS
jgi:hypothetical protein